MRVGIIDAIKTVNVNCCIATEDVDDNPTLSRYGQQNYSYDQRNRKLTKLNANLPN